MRWSTTQRLQNEFALPRLLASGIIAEQWQAAVRYRWPPWVWLACWAPAELACWRGWLPWSRGVHDHGAVWLMVVAGWGWFGIGRWLSVPAIPVAAGARARQLRRAGEVWATHECGAGNTTSSTASPPAEMLQP